MNAKKHVVLLNGPPGCGKDTVATHLVPYLQFHKMKFAAPIKRAVCGLLDMSESTLERHKNEPFSILRRESSREDENFGNTIYEYSEPESPRRLLIDLSESFLKVKYGETIFGRIAYRELQRSASDLIIFTDSGFAAEANAIIRFIGKENCILVRLHREGCTFEGDSRSYLEDIAGRNEDIDNNGHISHTIARVARVIKKQWNIETSSEIELL